MHGTSLVGTLEHGAHELDVLYLDTWRHRLLDSADDVIGGEVAQLEREKRAASCSDLATGIWRGNSMTFSFTAMSEATLLDGEAAEVRGASSSRRTIWSGRDGAAVVDGRAAELWFKSADRGRPVAWGPSDEEREQWRFSPVSALPAPRELRGTECALPSPRPYQYFAKSIHSGAHVTAKHAAHTPLRSQILPRAPQSAPDAWQCHGSRA